MFGVAVPHRELSACQIQRQTRCESDLPILPITVKSSGKATVLYFIYLAANFTHYCHYFNQLHEVVAYTAFQSTDMSSQKFISGIFCFFDVCEIISCVVSGWYWYTVNNPISYHRNSYHGQNYTTK